MSKQSINIETFDKIVTLEVYYHKEEGENESDIPASPETTEIYMVKYNGVNITDVVDALEHINDNIYFELNKKL